MIKSVIETLMTIVSSPIFQIEVSILFFLSLWIAWKLRSIPRIRQFRPHKNSRP